MAPCRPRIALGSPPPRAGRPAGAGAGAREAFAGQVGWLETDLLPRSADRVGIGATKFRKLVRLRGLGMTVAALRAGGTRYLRSSKRELARLAHEVKAGGGGWGGEGNGEGGRPPPPP